MFFFHSFICLFSSWSFVLYQFNVHGDCKIMKLTNEQDDILRTVSNLRRIYISTLYLEVQKQQRVFVLQELIH